MEILIWSALLFMFVIWCHGRVMKLYQPNTNAPLPAAPRSLVKLLFLFLGCAAFVMLVLHIQNVIDEHHFQRLASEFKHVQTSNLDPQEMMRNMGNGAEEPPTGSLTQEPFIELMPAGSIKTNFEDVAGLKEAKEEVMDFVQFLRDPKSFQRLGAKPPKGLLMYGPPGVGKTLLARAMAGEANVGFLAVSGSQFDEEYIGVGAARVRKLFKTARKHTPCVIFIDEIDSVAANRNHHHTPAGAQTVNQLLTELDGLDEEANEGIIVIAASNRLEALDPAILRPGRFDRQVKLDLPTQTERQEILHIHLKNVSVTDELDVESLARGSTGFSSADLANWINEAAIHATKHGKDTVDIGSFDVARDRMILGAEHSSLIMSTNEKTITAYHEAGHTLIGFLLEDHDPIYKVTIAPRGPSLGHTAYQPEAERYSQSKTYLENRLKSALAGRIAEELIFGTDQITTGASGDFKGATDLAFNMVAHWGFSDKIGKVYYDKDQGIISEDLIQQEVRKLIDKNYIEAKKLMEQNMDKLHALAKALLEHETLDAEQVQQIMS